MVHGGISVRGFGIDDYVEPDRDLLTEVLWNDPYDEYGYRPSYRGAGFLFGSDVTSKFLRDNNLNLIIRGHEPCNGYMWRHNRRLLTIFSRLGPPYFNNRAAVAEVPLNLEIDADKISFITIDASELPSL
jgi:hypothetical protein